MSIQILPNASGAKRAWQLLIENWRRFECNVISAETGTFNAPSEWVEAPENYPLYLRLLAQLNRRIYLAIEHLTLDALFSCARHEKCNE